MTFKVMMHQNDFVMHIYIFEELHMQQHWSLCSMIAMMLRERQSYLSYY